jgi:hypothetical protein
MSIFVRDARAFPGLHSQEQLIIAKHSQKKVEKVSALTLFVQIDKKTPSISLSSSLSRIEN